MRRIGVLLVWTGWLGACGWEADGGARLQAMYHPDVGARDSGGVDVPVGEGNRDALEGTDLSPGEVSGSSLQGTWMGRIVQQGKILPLLVPWPITTTDWLVGTATANEILWRLCTEVPVVHDEEPDYNYVSRMPEGTAQALRDRRPIRLEIEGGTLKDQSVLWTWGLANPQDDQTSLPTDPTDSRVEDTDEDGHPGVTMEVLEPVVGRRYLVRRVRFTFPPTTVSGDGVWLVGSLDYTIAEQAVGADPKTLKANAPIEPTNGSFFQFRRVSEADCDRLMSLKEAAFDGAPSR